MELRKIYLQGPLSEPFRCAGQESKSINSASADSCSCQPDEPDYLSDPLGIRKPWSEESSASPVIPSPNQEEESEDDIKIPWLENSASPSKQPSPDIPIRKEGQKLILTINTDIYPTEAVLLAAEEFKELCWVTLARTAGLLTVGLSPKNQDGAGTDQDPDQLGRNSSTIL
jgi:hypothetical protein